MPPRLSWQHPEPDLRLSWLLLQVGLLLLPFSAFAGSVCMLTLIGWVAWRRWRVLVADRLNWLLLGLSVWLGLTGWLSPDRTAAWLGLANFLPLFALFATASLLIRQTWQIRTLGWWLVLGSLPVNLLAFGQRFWGWSGHLQVLSLVVNLRLEPTGNPPFRPASVFDYTNVLASYLVLVLSLGLGLLLWEWRQGKQWRTTVALAGMLGLGAVVILLTETRNAWGVLLGVGGAYALWLGWGWLLAAFAAVAAATWGAVQGQGWLRALVPEFIWGRLAGRLEGSPPLPALRTTQWRFAWDLAQQRPLTGWGLRNFSALYQTKTDFWVGHPHNFYLMLCAETGLPATLALLWVIGRVVLFGVQRLAAWVRTQPGDALLLFSALVALGSCGLFGLLDVTMFDIRVNILGWVLLAVVYGVSRPVPAQTHEATPE